MKNTLNNLIALGIIFLLGTEGRDWAYFETDPEWWALKLYLRRN
ncbi:hypothetical protein ES705_27831 [subsurface metagenome]